MITVPFGIRRVIHGRLRPDSGCDEKTAGIEYTPDACLNQTGVVHKGRREVQAIGEELLAPFPRRRLLLAERLRRRGL
jgi:hypothetical protein